MNAEPSSLVLRQARIVGRDSRTGGPGEPCDVLVRDGVVRAIGTRDELAATGLAEALPEVELAGRYLLPGLRDNHVHFVQHAATRRRLDVSAATSAAAAAALVTARITEGPAPDDGLLVGHGFRDGLWADEPTRELLDAAAPGVAVVLVSGDLHCGWLNSAALTRFGHPGEHPGLLREDDWYPVAQAKDEVPADVLDRWVAEAVTQAAARGVTGVVELEMAPNPDDWTRRAHAGIRGLRVSCGVYEPHLEDAIARGLRTGDPLPGTGGLITMGPFKAITDGSLNTRTAYCHDPYPGNAPHPYGILNLPPQRLVPLMRRAAAHGIDTAIHAIGDHANQLVLDAFETTGARGSIEHAQLLSAADIRRFAALGITASIQPEHLLDDRDVADTHWAGRTHRAFPFADLLTHGTTLALGSDAPVAPLDPWITLAAAVHRSRDHRPQWHPEQTIPIDAALAASTSGKHTLHCGDPADLTIVEHDPIHATPDQLRTMPVWGTLLAGRWSWHSDNAG